MSKVVSLEELARVTARARADGKKVALAHGVFDLLHIGHIRYLRQAAQLGDLLVVTITADQFVDKGPGRPAFPGQLRAEALASLGFVDYVAVNHTPTAENVIRALAPAFYAKGAEYRDFAADKSGRITLEAAAAAEVGAEMIFIDDLVYSSSSLINQHLSIYSEELTQYLGLLRRRHRLDEVLAWLEKMRELSVLVVGDAIIDEYRYCTPLGLSSKDPTMVVRLLSEECFAGGALAVARHLAGFAGRVALYTQFGRDRGAAVRAGLPQSVELICDELEDRPTVRKTRHVDQYSMTKFLEVYDFSPEPIPRAAEEAAFSRLAGMVKDFDVVLAADFGHGLLTERLVGLLCRDAPFLAVNTQANAGNRGYHTIFRYPRADFASLAHHELALAFQDRRTPVPDQMRLLARRLNLETLLVTCGQNGLNALRGDEFVVSPAVAARVVDRVGAGDALFAVTSLLARLGCPLELMGLMGNLAGAKLVESVGNEISVTADDLRKPLTAMLK